eukprot:3538474-Rhodomonas_salina.1
MCNDLLNHILFHSIDELRSVRDMCWADVGWQTWDMSAERPWHNLRQRHETARKGCAKRFCMMLVYAATV